MATLVPNLTVLPLVADSRLSALGAVRGYREAVANGTHAMLVGRSSTTEFVCTLSHLDRMPLCSYLSSASEFSDKAAYPYFARTMPSVDQAAAQLPRLLAHFGWRSIAILQLNDPYATGYAQALRDAAPAAGVAVILTAT